MSLTAKARKILWARAGNQCAFPGCKQHLVEKDAGVGADIVVGEEAHIVPRSRNGPRGRKWNHEEELDSYSNRILLCPKHHKFVDGAPEIYTKECLIDMKSAHQWRVADDQRSAEELRGVGVTIPGVIGLSAHVWHLADSIIAVESYGSPPIRLDHDHWRAAGVRISQFHANKDPHCLFESSEAELDIEYWLSDSKFHVVQEAHLYDENRFAPFVKHEFDLKKMPALSTVELLLNVDPSLIAGIPVLVKEIRSIDRDDNSERLDVLLFRLWKAGLSDPGRVCEEFRRFKAAWWYDGAMAEEVTSMTKELGLVQRAKANNQNVHRQ